jgi:hypothetical protein
VIDKAPGRLSAPDMARGETYACAVPMTLSHPAAVVPLRRSGLPMSAMVIGSMVPDVPLFLGWRQGYVMSHSWTGAVTVDLAATLVLLTGWNSVVRDALVDLAPAAVRGRLAARNRLSQRQWLLTPAAAVLGSLTHLVWDAFTHRNRWGVALFDWLQADLGPLPGYKWAQYTSGVIGLLVVIGTSIAFLRSRPSSHSPRPRSLPAPLLPLLVAAAAGYGLIAGLAQGDRGVHAVAFEGATSGIAALAIATAIACLSWLLFVRR